MRLRVQPTNEEANFREGSDHILAVLSSDDVTKYLESGEKLTDRTGPLCPFIITDSPFAFGIHKRTVLSFDAEARTSPSGENLTSVTAAV